jgi:hypothetical protein
MSLLPVKLITVEHCLSGDGNASGPLHFTKPLQGVSDGPKRYSELRFKDESQSACMCDADLGWDRPDTMKHEQEQDGASPSPQECVGTRDERAYST